MSAGASLAVMYQKGRSAVRPPSIKPKAHAHDGRITLVSLMRLIGLQVYPCKIISIFLRETEVETSGGDGVAGAERCVCHSAPIAQLHIEQGIHGWECDLQNRFLGMRRTKDRVAWDAAALDMMDKCLHHPLDYPMDIQGFPARLGGGGWLLHGSYCRSEC